MDAEENTIEEGIKLITDSADADCIDLGKVGVVGLPGMVLEAAEDRWRDYLQIVEAD